MCSSAYSTRLVSEWWNDGLLHMCRNDVILHRSMKRPKDQHSEEDAGAWRETIGHVSIDPSVPLQEIGETGPCLSAN